MTGASAQLARRSLIVLAVIAALCAALAAASARGFSPTQGSAADEHDSHHDGR